MKIITNTLYIVFGLMVISSCTKDFVQMNTNPNSPSDVPPDALLGKVIMQSAKNLDNFVVGTNNYHYSQNTYVLEDLGVTPGNDLTAIWNNTYAIVVNNAKIIEAKAKETGDKNMEAVSEILMVHAYHNLTDLFGDIPYTTAVSKEGGLVVNPTYDKQKDIYTDLLVRIKKANEMMDVAGKISGDFMFSGNMLKWKKFANSLRLRIAIRMADVDPATSKSEVADIMGNPGKYPIISDNADDAELKWVGATPYNNPLFDAYKSGTDNYAVSDILVNQFKQTNDPRLSVYAKPAKATNMYVGAIHGPVLGGIPNRDQVSRIGTYFTSNPAGYTRFLLASENWLNIAEASELGYSTNLSASTAYTNGIKASLEYVHIAWDATALQTFLGNPAIQYVVGDKAGNLQKIRMQKWISLYLVGYQGWAEARRTDVPLLAPGPGTRIPGHNRAPFRLSYPTSEQNLNKNNWSKAQADNGITTADDILWGKQMWWDKRVNVK